MDELRTPRLELRPLAPADRDALHAHWSGPEVRRYLWDGRIISPEEVDDAIERSGQLFREHHAGLWAIRPRGASELIGCGGFWFFHAPPEQELLLSLDARWWGRGLGTEAAGALLTHAFEGLGWDAVQASADTPNTSSLALMGRLGMRPAGERPGEFGTIEVFRITREGWPKDQEPGANASHAS